MSAVCPACGVAVVPGYAKCPRCQKPLPYGSPRNVVAGGTVAEDRRFPWALIAVPLSVVIVIALLLKLIAGGSDDDAPVTAGSNQPAVTAVQPQGTVAVQAVEPTSPTQPEQPVAPDPNAAVGELDRLLRSRRLWSTVETVSPRVDVRSSSCDDPTMRTTIDSVAVVLRRAGLTRLRCLAQSGSVVFERAL